MTRSVSGTRALLALSSLLAVSACAHGSATVTRITEGVRYEGRFINPEAYAAYLLGVEREAEGAYDEALSAYSEALAEDPDSPEIWARIGAVRCVSASKAATLVAAESAFERSLRLDAQYFGAYFERARCAERARRFRAGLEDATLAVARRPDDESANLLVARLLQALGQRAKARAWLEAFQSFHRPTAAVRQAVEAARGATSRAPVAAPAAAAPPAYSAAFAALRAGDLDQARARARTELDADPSNADAWIATLFACDALHDEPCFERTLDALERPSLDPSPVALSYLRDLLARRAGALSVPAITATP